MERKFEKGSVVQHFKREMLGEKDSQHLYIVLVECAENTETGEKYVIYESLGTGKIYARNRDSFYSEVDYSKYPKAKQKYRFEEYYGIKK